ncbi:hypothetical protein EDB92DRAFT_1817990 [Lactarius akahatsu]|uniref:Uncharacterized protein n=1 Tax=Lactarius akahatsu TaxID=416441 RepID=A0AAD4LB57_9AGAM|nr:hypothetical protein EDB92DRAFT_1817990 [Lactarius akahatsu]
MGPVPSHLLILLFQIGSSWMGIRNLKRQARRATCRSIAACLVTYSISSAGPATSDKWNILVEARAGTRGRKLHASPEDSASFLLFWSAFSILAFLSDTLGPRAPPTSRRVHAVGAKLLHKLFPIHGRSCIQILPNRSRAFTRSYTQRYPHSISHLRSDYDNTYIVLFPTRGQGEMRLSRMRWDSSSHDHLAPLARARARELTLAPSLARALALVHDWHHHQHGTDTGTGTGAGIITGMGTGTVAPALAFNWQWHKMALALARDGTGTGTGIITGMGTGTVAPALAFNWQWHGMALALAPLAPLALAATARGTFAQNGYRPVLPRVGVLVVGRPLH